MSRNSFSPRGRPDDIAPSPQRLIADLRESLAKVEQVIDMRVAILRDQVMRELRGEDARLAELLDALNCDRSECPISPMSQNTSIVSPMAQKFSCTSDQPRSKWSDKFYDVKPTDLAIDVGREHSTCDRLPRVRLEAGFGPGRGSCYAAGVEDAAPGPLTHRRSSGLDSEKAKAARASRLAPEEGAIEVKEKAENAEPIAESDSNQKVKASEEPVRRPTRASAHHPRSGFLYRFVTSVQFEAMVSVCILTNCATMGLEAQHMAAEDLPPAVVMLTYIGEHVFTAFFFLEFLVNWKVFGLRHFRPSTSDGRANFADAVLAIGTGVLLAWVIPLFALILGVAGNKGAWRSLSVLRALRLARLVRVFRKVPLFREAWMLIRGLSDSARTLLWTVVVVLFVTYTFAIFGIVLIVENLKMARDDYPAELDQVRLANLLVMTQGVDKMMYTLVQVLAGDSFHQFMREILIYVPFSWVYFYTYIAIASLVLMNLVTAIIVDNAMETSRSDKEQMYSDKEAARAKELKDLERMFVEMDVDGSGTLCWDEFDASFDDDTLRKKWILLDFRHEDCRALFDLLDNGDGEVSYDEFFEGLFKMRGVAQAKDMFLLQKMVQKLHRRLPRDWSSEGYMARVRSARSQSDIGSPRVRSSMS